MRRQTAPLMLILLWLLSSAADGQTPAPDGPEFVVNTYTPDMQIHPSVAMTPDGNFVVAWDSYNQDGSYVSVFGQRFAAGGTPQGGEFQANTYTTGMQYFPAVAVDDSGNFVVVWSGKEQNAIMGQRYTADGTPAGGEFQVNTYTTGYLYDAAVAADSNGDFVVVWTRDNPGYPTVFGQMFDAGGAPQGTEFQVSSYGDQKRPSVAMDDDGNFVVVWESYLGSYHAFAQRFSAAGSPVGGEFPVSSGTGYPGNLSVAIDQQGNFVVVWAESG